jgi:hypothetical protein
MWDGLSDETQAPESLRPSVYGSGLAQAAFLLTVPYHISRRTSPEEYSQIRSSHSSGGAESHIPYRKSSLRHFQSHSLHSAWCLFTPSDSSGQGKH